MNIGFNLLPYSVGKHGGAEVYFRSVIESIQKANGSHDIFLFGDADTVEQYRVPGASCHAVPVDWPGKSSRLTRSLAEQVILPLLCVKHRLDCLVSNYVAPIAAPCKTVTVVHDMLYRRYPESFERKKLIYWKALLPPSIRHSSAVVAVSEFSASEIVSFFPSVKDKVFVTVEGVRPSFAAVAPASRPVREGDYLLCVATFGKHKNLHALVKAFAALPESCSGLSLVLVGAARTPDARQYRAELESRIEAEGLTGRVVFTDHVSDEELASLYRGAAACVLPSLYEGFGLPVIEAQHFGCPVLCSDRASLPEIAGKAAITFDPTSTESIRDAIVSVVARPEMQDQLRRAGYENVSRYSWERAAEQLMKAIEFAVQYG